MSAALPNKNTLDRCAATRTGFVGASIHPEVVLEIPAAINPVDACAIVLDPGRQDGSNRIE